MKKLFAIALSMLSAICLFASCGDEKTAIIPKTAFIEIEVDNSEETGELSYTEPLKIDDFDEIEALIEIVNSAEKHTEDEFVTFESCPIVTFHLSDGSRLYLCASDYKGIFYTCKKWDFSDKTLYQLADDFKLESYIETLYTKNK